MKRTQFLVMCALFTALIIVGAFIKIPIPVVPFTLQVLFTTLAGALLGSKGGAISTACYAFLGLIGIPVFTQGGGFGYVLQPSFGYILGFIAGAFVTGLIVERAKNLTFARSLIANFAGLIIVYAMGMVYYYLICKYALLAPIGLWNLFFYCFLMVVPGDICPCVLAAVLTKKIRPIIKKYEA